MSGALFRAGRGLLFALPPETAHTASIAALKSGLPVCRPPQPSPRLATRVAGIDFPNPLGMAAGYDKNAEAPDGLLSLGFGFVECGTVTPRPQQGNARPRLFRLTQDRAIINRLGFNNQGHARFRERLEARRGKHGIVGVNIGANADSTDRAGDYEAGIRAFAGLASYLAINISSPNTAGLRTLQSRDNLGALLARLVGAREETIAAGGPPTPVFLKIAPDLSDDELADVAAEVAAHGVDGVIVANTTLARPGMEGSSAREAGGLSGRPLLARSTIALARMRRMVGPDLPLIGVGGVDSAETAIDKIRAGADLVQLYSGLVFEGPSLPGRILRGLDAFTVARGLANIRDSGTDEWAERHIE